MSRLNTLEFCRRPSSLIVFGCLTVATVLTVWNLRSDSNPTSNVDVTDSQMELDLRGLGALGVSDSAIPDSGSVQTQFSYEDEAESPIFNNDSAFLNSSTVSSATLDFDSTPNYASTIDSAGPRFGRPLTISDSQPESEIQQTGFRQSEGDYAGVSGAELASGARVTANQAVWLTGSIEAR